MRSITAVEIGADTCALASTSVRSGEVHVAAAETLDPAAFPGIDAFTLALRQTRKALKLPRRCRAVVWGLPDGARRRDPIVAPLVEPLTRAGFRVARVVTPCNALGALARLRTSRTGGAMCWLGVNRNGVAIVVIRPGKMLYSHSFAWDSNVGASGSQARLLQRYSLVAFLAPEVRRALAVAQQKGTTIDGIVTCGNLPDLRSLTMPLIEELDIEVETLDSLEGLQMKPELADKLSEVAPAIRLACAGAFARETRTVDEGKRVRVRRMTRAAAWLLPIAALLALLAAGYWWYVRRSGAVSAPPSRGAATGRPAPAPASTPGTSPAAKAPPAPAPVLPAPTNTPPAPSATPAVSAAPQTAISTPAPQAEPKNAPPTSPPADKPVSAIPQPAAPLQTKPSAAANPMGTVNPRAFAADKPGASAAGGPPVKQSQDSTPELLTDPVPRFTAILVAADRRLATVGDEGQIVGVGDTIGKRVVVAIDERTVLLREPSGVQIRVALGGRVVGVERGGR